MTSFLLKTSTTILSVTCLIFPDSDSLSYLHLKQKLQVTKADSLEYSSIITATDQIFNQGLYKDAYTLLKTLYSEKRADKKKKRETQPQHSWSFISSLSYWDIESILSDTAVLTETERDSIERLLETPIYSDNTIEYTYRDISCIIRGVSLSLGISGTGENRAQGIGLSGIRLKPGLDMDIRDKGGKYSLRLSAKGEKRVMEENYRSQEYDQGIKRDNFFSEMELRYNKGSKALNLDIPISFEAGVFRENTPGYLSSLSYFSSPCLKFSLPASGAEVFSSYKLKFNDRFNRESDTITADTSDTFMHGPEAVIRTGGDIFKNLTQFSFVKYYFIKQKEMKSSTYLDFSVLLRQKFSELLPNTVSAALAYQTERHSGYTLSMNMYTYKLKYNIRVFHNLLSIEPYMEYSRTIAPVKEVDLINQFLIENSSSVSTGLELSFDYETIEITSGYEFGYEKIPEKEDYTKNNSKEHTLKLSIRWNPYRDLFIDAQMNKGYITENTESSDRSEEVSLNANLSLFF